MVGQLEPEIFGNLFLPSFDDFVGELAHLAAFHAKNMIVMVTPVQLENGISAFEMKALHQPRRFELGQNPVDGSQTNFLTLFQKVFVNIFGREMVLRNRRVFQHFQNLYPRQRHLEAGVSDFLSFQCVISEKRVMPLRMGYDFVFDVADRSWHFYMRKLVIIITYFISMLLISCATIKRVTPSVSKVDVDQGNIVTQEMVDQLHPHMTKQQVQFIMGTPLLIDVFHQKRWDYIYSQHPGGDVRTQKRISLFFDDERLAGVQGDFRPSSLPPAMETKETTVDLPKRKLEKTLFQKIKGVFGRDD